MRYFSACLLLGRCANPAAQLRKNCGRPGYSIRVSCTCFLRCRRARDLFFMDSKGDVRHFFWLVFRKPLARILLLFEAFASGFPRPDVEMISERVQTSVYLAIIFVSMVFLLVYTCFTCFLRCRRARDLFSMDSKGDVRHFFWLVFRKPLARILLLFEAFASGFPRPDVEMISERVQTSVYLAIVFFSVVFLLVYTCFTCFLRCRRARDLFFMDSKGDVRHFFWLVFRKPLARILLLFEAFASGFPRPDFEMIAERIQTSVYLAIVFFSMVFLAKLFCMVESCCCTADKRVT